VIGKIQGGVLNLAALDVEIVSPVTINTVFTTTGDLTINADTTFNVNPALGNDVVIKAGKKLILGPAVEIARGTELLLTDGVYQADLSDVEIPTTGIIMTTGPARSDAGLKIGATSAGIDENYIALLNQTANAATFTPAANGAGERVIFGKNGIVIPAQDSGTGGKLTVSGSNPGRVKVIGAGINITLKVSGSATLAVAEAGKLYLENDAFLQTSVDGGYKADGQTTATLPTGYTLPLTIAKETSNNGVEFYSGTAGSDAVINSEARHSAN
jgi:hypothetical protein